jgi:hypothetical protein
VYGAAAHQVTCGSDPNASAVIGSMQAGEIPIIRWFCKNWENAGCVGGHLTLIADTLVLFSDGVAEGMGSVMRGLTL